MNRRETVFALLALGGTSFATQAQQQTKVVRIAYLGFGNPEAAGHLVDAFRQKMRDLGYVEGKSLVLDIRWAFGKADRLPDLAKELVALNPHAIVALNASTARAMQKATTTIPIVIGTISDPVAFGLVKSLAQPGGNITGTSSLAADFGPKLLELLRAVAPDLSRVTMLFGPDPIIETLTQTQIAAKKLGVSIEVVNVQTPLQIENAFARMPEEKTKGIIGWPSGLFYAQRRQIAALAIKSRMPSIFPASEYTEAGILMSYGSSYINAARDAAIYVDKILKGANPGDLPIQQPTVFELVVNLKTAKLLGITIPQSILVRADRVIE